MPDKFEIDVPVHGTIRVFEAEFRKIGYRYQVVVSIEGREIVFEPDDKRNFRAIAKLEKYKPSLSDTIQATAQVLTDLLRNDTKR